MDHSWKWRRGVMARAVLGGMLALLGSASTLRPTAGLAAVRPAIVQAPALPGAQAISVRDRVYTADQTSNTVTVIDPSTDEVLGTLPMGSQRLDGLLGARYFGEFDTHGLGFSPDGSLLDVINVTSNSAVVVRTATNALVDTFYVGRAPHEGFVTPDGRELWIAVRGQNWVSVIDLKKLAETQTGGALDSGTVGDEIARIRTAAGPAMVVFSPDGRRAFVNHDRAPELDVIDVSSHHIIARVTGLDSGFSPNLAVTPDGAEVWLTHKGTGRTSVVDARHLQLLTVLNTGPVTNHVNFVSKPDGIFAYVTVGQPNKTLVFRTGGAHPTKVGEILHNGFEPHGIWPSPDNTRVYVGMEKSDAVDVIDTGSNQVIDTMRVGQEPQALVYVANAVTQGGGRDGLTRQGLDKRVLTRDLPVAGGVVRVTIREVDTLDQIQVVARGLPANTAFSVQLANSGGETTAIRRFMTNAQGGAEFFAFIKFFDAFGDVAVIPV
jgi:YVTN family beta-propeller protein